MPETPGTTDAVNHARQRVADLEQELARLDAFIPDLQRRLRRRSSEPVPADGEVRALRIALTTRVSRAQAAIDAHKARAKQRKREIDHWKAWHGAGIPAQGGAPAALARLEREVAWRAADIAAAEAAIAALEAEKWHATGELHDLLDSLEAAVRVDAGTPVAKDPRLVAARRARDWAADRLREAQHHLAGLLAGGVDP
jgi:hypothetical protein